MNILEAQGIRKEVNLSLARVKLDREGSWELPNGSIFVHKPSELGPHGHFCCLGYRRKLLYYMREGRAMGQKQAPKISKGQNDATFFNTVRMYSEDGGADEGPSPLPSTFRLLREDSEHKPHCKFQAVVITSLILNFLPWKTETIPLTSLECQTE